jgi:hypothetical protein
MELAKMEPVKMELGHELDHEPGHGTRGQDLPGSTPRPFFYLSLMPGFIGVSSVCHQCQDLMSGSDYLTFAMNKYDHKWLISHYLLWKFCAGEI